MNVLLVSLQKNVDVSGLKFLHYYLLHSGYNSFLLCLPNFDKNDSHAFNNIIKFIDNKKPGFIGISLMSLEYSNAAALTDSLKNRFSNIPVIWGGIHPTIDPDTCLVSADYVCLGEGERSILDFADAANTNGDPKGINNLCYMENGRLRKNPMYPLIENLDDIPSYEHIPDNGFLQEKNGLIQKINKKAFRRYNRFRGTIYDTVSSRGCPFKCTFCCNNSLADLYDNKSRIIRRRGIENVILELEKAVNQYPEIEYIHFLDDCFSMASRNHIKDFCNVYKERVRRPFITHEIPTNVEREKVKYMKNAGLVWVEIGLQSGSDVVCKDIYKRGSCKADYLNSMKIMRDNNVAVVCDVILDNPYEKEEEKLETLQALIETPRPVLPHFFSLTLYKGTELHDMVMKEYPYKKNDYLDKDYFDYEKNVINDMTRIAGFLGQKYMIKMVGLYRTNPKGKKFKTMLFFGKLLSSVIIEPYTYFQLIKISQRGSTLKALKVLPGYFKEGFKRYFKQYTTGKKRETKR
jgi:radical SAM superfamily enzyme YgiQ (UPF0313 family)